VRGRSGMLRARGTPLPALGYKWSGDREAFKALF